MSDYKLDFEIPELKKYADLHGFKGFNKEEVARMFYAKVPKEMSCEVLVVCAIVSPAKAVDKVLSNGKTLRTYGFGTRPRDGLTPARVQVVFAAQIADILRKISATKKLDLACPAHLQFFGAASLNLSTEERKQHIEFCVEFSKRIGGEFRPELYELTKKR